MTLQTKIVLIEASGARFTKHLKPKIFLSALQFVWHLKNLRLKMFSETGTRFFQTNDYFKSFNSVLNEHKFVFVSGLPVFPESLFTMHLKLFTQQIFRF